MSKKNCQSCGVAFDCDVQSAGICWCMRYPLMLEPDESQDCFCENCLTAQIAPKVETLVQQIADGDHPRDISTYLGPSRKPVEQIDYYLEYGNWVFTAWFHLKRGKCCGNGCRHCPYEYENVPECGRNRFGQH